jgi:hydrogenase maturation factor HypF (carbamoyltransferase family)
MLENAAARALRLPDAAYDGGNTKEPSPCVDDCSADALALRFHLDVAHAILSECREARAKRGANIVCLSGGVFQNKILTEEALRILRADGFIPYYNVAVPPNDGCIALGQAYVAMQTML